MSAVRRVSKVVAGLLAGVLLAEGGLQLVRVGARASDAARAEHARSEQGGDLRVLCLGACYTVGVGTPSEQSYPAQLERALDARGLDAVVLNRGVRGRSIDYFAARIDGLLDAHDPDVVVVGVNRRMAAVQAADASVFDALLLPKMVALAAAPTVVEAETSLEGPRAVDEDTRLEASGAEDSLSRKATELRERLEADPSQGALWSELADLEAGRGDFEAARAALLRSPDAGELRPPVRMRLLRYALGSGDYGEASHQLDTLRATPGFPERFAARVGERAAQYASDGRDVEVRTSIDRARAELLFDRVPEALALAEEVLRLDPDFTDAHQLKLYALHLLGEALPAPSQATLRREAEPATDPRFAASLAVYLDRVQAAAEARGASVVVHTLGATHSQRPIIRDLARARGIPVADLLGALSREAAPDRLFHPSDHLRLSAEGNRWMAEQILAVLDASELSRETR